MTLLAIALGSSICDSFAAAQPGDGGAQGAVAVTVATPAGTLLNGYRRYNAGCNHCHGPDGVGSSFATSLIAVPLDADTFRDAVLNGQTSGNGVMKGYADDPNVAPFVDDIYAYLRARADGRIGRGRPQARP